MKDFWAFLIQLALLWPLSFLACVWLLGLQAVPYVVTWQPALALAFGAVAGSAVTAIWPGLRWSAQLVCVVPLCFAALGVVSQGQLSPDYYVVSQNNEGGLGVAVVTLPTAFYVGYSAAAFLRRNRRPPSGVPDA